MLKFHKTSDMFRSPLDHPQGVCQSLLKLHYVPKHVHLCTCFGFFLHGIKMKIISAQQAKICNIYKNTKLKLLKTNTSIWLKKHLHKCTCFGT